MNLIKKRYLPVVFMWYLLTICLFFIPHTQVQAASKISNTKQIEQTIKKSIKKGENTIKFTTYEDYSAAQIQNILEAAAISQSRMLSGSIQLSKRIDGTGSIDYTIELSDDAFIKVKVLSSKSDAAKAAAKALKNAKYTTNYYSEKLNVAAAVIV